MKHPKIPYPHIKGHSDNSTRIWKESTMHSIHVRAEQRMWMTKTPHVQPCMWTQHLLIKL